MTEMKLNIAWCCNIVWNGQSIMPLSLLTLPGKVYLEDTNNFEKYFVQIGPAYPERHGFVSAFLDNFQGFWHIMVLQIVLKHFSGNFRPPTRSAR